MWKFVSVNFMKQLCRDVTNYWPYITAAAGRAVTKVKKSNKIGWNKDDDLYLTMEFDWIGHGTFCEWMKMITQFAPNASILNSTIV